ncbi:hypothetical protein ACFL0H_01960 [Thermodesulfobacteriota bacterium]
MAVQILPLEITFEGAEEFPDTGAVIGFIPTSGDWNLNADRYEGPDSPAKGGPQGVLRFSYPRELENISCSDL